MSYRLDEAELRLGRALQRHQQLSRTQLQHAEQHLSLLNPGRRLVALQALLARQRDQLGQQLEKCLLQHHLTLEKNAGLLHSVSPLKTLRRGYAIVSDRDGLVIRRSQDVLAGDTINIRLGEGDLDAKVL